METAELFRRGVGASGVRVYVECTFRWLMESRCRAADLARESGLSEMNIVVFANRFSKDPDSVPVFDFDDCRKLNRAIMAVTGRKTLGSPTSRYATARDHEDDVRFRKAEMQAYRERGREWLGR